MADILPDALTSRLAEAERAATPGRHAQRRDWLVLVLTAIAAPIAILLIGWGLR